MAAAASSTATATASASQSVRLAKRAMRKSMGVRLAAVSKEDVVSQSTSITRTLLASRLYRDARTISVYLNTPSGEVDTHELCLDALRNHKTVYVPSFATASPTPDESQESERKSLTPASEKKKPQFAAEMSMLHILDEKDLLSLPTNSYGIREPSLDDLLPSETTTSRRRTEALAPHTHGGTGLDLIVCPGLAFDLQGGRLGHGKGYYDRYLLRAKEWALREQNRHRTGEEKTSRDETQTPIVLALSLRQQLLSTEEGSVPMDERDVQLDGILTPDSLILPPEGLHRAVNDAKVDPIPGGKEHVLELAEATGVGADWRSWGFQSGIRVLQGGKVLS
ncbi:hypothetical protein CF326_g520 [Tilletia indica]|nr:hypothetical protein CF326_g520 [Tilletia indica]